MKTEDRCLIIHYLNNALKGPLSPEVQENLWRWAESHSQELFRLDLEQIGDQVAEDIEDQNPGRGRQCYGRIRAAKTRLLKKTAAKHSAGSGLAERGGGLAEKIADTFGLKGPERDVMRLTVGVMYLPALERLMHVVVDRDFSGCLGRKHFPALSQLLGLSAGGTERAFRPESPLLINGLFNLDCDGEIVVSEPLKKMLNQPRQANRDIKSLVLEKKTAASLTRTNFEHLADDYDYLANLLRRGLKESVRGLNILLYGPPGTGKTELAKTLAAEIKADLYPVSETSTENRQSARLAELQMARTLVAGEARAMLMVDEAEDVFWAKHRDEKGSKLFFNRMLERNETPVIWISNLGDCLNPAYLRRFTYALEMKTPPASARALIWQKELARKKVKMTKDEVEHLAKNYELPPSYAVSAIRAAKLVRDKRAIERTLKSLDYAVTGRRKVIKPEKKADFNLALLNTDTDLAQLTERVLKARPNFSLCLYGAPGTGKSEYARHLAEKMGLQVLHKRASDLISKFVGQTEQNIAAAFAEAREEGKLLIFDEADSFLQDRRGAHYSWEVTRVNEMLTWMECHPYPFVCTTNLMERLDQASLRRFIFKVRYNYLTRDQARLAFRHFFGCDYDLELEALTPGDFVVAASKASILGLTEPAELAAFLAQEQEAKGIKSTVMGFQIQ